MILVDPPTWPGWGRTWSHLVSDTSTAELHAFAARLGVPRRLFDEDHYDIPVERYDEMVAAGATEVSGSDLIRRLIASGLRVTRAERRDGQAPDRG